MKHRGYSSRAIVGLLAPVLASITLLAACSQDPIGIFASLSLEKPIGADSTKALSSISPSRVVRYETPVEYDGEDQICFFMSSGYVYYRPMVLSKDSWQNIPGLEGLPQEACRCVEIAAADRLYAAWLDENFSSLGLYASVDAKHWTRIAPEEDAITLSSGSGVTREIAGLFALNGRVFASVKQIANEAGTAVTRFKLYLVDGDDAVDCGLDRVYDPENPYVKTAFRSGAYDGSSYWFVSGSSLYRGTIAGAPSFARVSEETDMPSGVSLSSVLWSEDLGRLLVASGSGVFDIDGTLTGKTPGVIYSREPDGSWEMSAPSVLVSDSSGGYANFTDIQAVRNSDGDPVIVASSAASLKYSPGKSQSNKAAEARGYGILVPTSGLSIDDRPVSSTPTSQDEIASWSSYETTLMSFAVNRLFYLDGSDNTRILFAGTSGKGLWSNSRVRGSNGGYRWGGWVKE